MGANPGGSRTARHPPSDLASHPLPRTRQIARQWFRVHPTAYDPVYFCLVPTHRYSHPKCKSNILYVGIDIQTCLWEIFGDMTFDNAHALPRTHWDSCSCSIIDVPPLHLCDLSNATTRGTVSVDLPSLMNDEVTLPQEWGLAIQEHPDQVPAIKFKSRFTGKACLAIFERGSIPAQLKETSSRPLQSYDPARKWLARNRISLV